MTVALTIGTLAAIWVITYFALIFPARWLGAWIAKKSSNSFLGIVLCIAFAKLFVVYAAVFLVFARLPFFHMSTTTLADLA
jgi:hypothetical protein